MRMVTLDSIDDETEFAKQAAAAFAGNEELATFSVKALEPGCLLALRWGMGNDCVLVVKLDECHEPVNYQGLVKQVERMRP